MRGAMWLFDRFLRRAIRTASLTVTDADGRRYIYGSPASPVREPPIAIRLTDRRAAGHIARYPSVGAGEAYMRGWLEVEPPHDIRDLVLMIAAEARANGATMAPAGRLRRTADAVAAWADQSNHRLRARRNVAHHYELGREFYELFLDADRQYTMAWFANPDATLEQAQREKQALIAAKLHLPADARGLRVLDIGCGWGGLGLFLHRHYGCEVLGISLAPDQIAVANARAAEAGCADSVRFEVRDYRDLEGRFDRITSVGMIEHVGARRFGEYFDRTRRLLAEDGVMLTHTIGRTGGPGLTDKWTRKYIFPGGYIPAMSELVEAIERTGWQLGDIEILRFHYALTLAEWYRRATANGEAIARLHDRQLLRMWQFYLAGAEQAFRNGSMVNFHLQTVKRQSTLPMTRDYIAVEMRRLLEREAAIEAA